MKSAKFITMTTISIAAGFTVGLIIGKKTRENVPSNVSTSYSGGVVTVKLNAGNALQSGVRDAIQNFL